MADGAILASWSHAEDGLHIAKVRVYDPIDSRKDLSAAIGFDAPPAVNRWTGNGSLMMAWVGPHEWLLIGAPRRFATAFKRIDAGLRAEAKLVVDITSGRRVFDLAGEEGLRCLAAMSPLDLREEAFPVGFAGRTRFGDIGIFVARLVGTPHLRIIVDQSQEDYFLQMMIHPC